MSAQLYAARKETPIYIELSPRAGQNTVKQRKIYYPAWNRTRLLDPQVYIKI
jgi:hypothetical protein